MGLLETILGDRLRQVAAIQPSFFWRKVMSEPTFQSWILDLIRNDQLFEQGIDSDGDVIGFYSYFTELMNPEKQEGTPYTLKDSGAFYESFLITIFNDYFEINADPIKEDPDTGEETNLFFKYGENIIGITQENLQRLQYEIGDRYRAEFQRWLK